MSGFFGSSETTSKWGGYFKQAISNVETTFDSFLEQPITQRQSSANEDTETETYIDPISGAVTTIEKPKSTKKTNSPSISTRPSLDLSSRLAAVMADKPKHLNVSHHKKSVKKNEGNEMTMTEKVRKEQEDMNVSEEKDKEEKISLLEVDMSVKKTEIEPTEDECLDSSKDTNRDNNEIKYEPVAAMEEDEDKTKQDCVETKSESEEKLAEPQNINRITHDDDDDKDRVLEQREQQLLQAMENIAKLHDQIHQLQEHSEKSECKMRDLETKLKKSEEENAQAGSSASLQKNVKRLEVIIEDLKKQISIKDEKIQGLLQEGEKLSKTEFKQTTTIKKLRLEKAEADKNLSELTKRLEKANASLLEASEKESRQAETEKRLQESVKLLSDLTEQQTRHINTLESEKIAHQKKITETEVTLKKTLESMEDERRKAKTEAMQSSAAALEKEIMANDRLHKELTKVKQDAEAMENKLKKEIRELQISLQTVEEQAGINEDHLRLEITELQSRLQQFDNKMDNINASVDEATAPLLRQIEELQTQHALAIKNRDQAEQSIILRMQTAEMERKRAFERDEKLQNDIKLLKEKLDESNSELENLKNKITILNSQVDADAVIKKELEERIQKLTEEKEKLNEKEARDQEALRAQYQRLMKERLNEERKQFEIKLNKATSMEISQLSNQDNSEESSNSMINNTRPSYTGTSSTSSRSSFDSSSTSPVVVSSILVERLQANVRRLENQLSFYQTQLQSSNQSRDELSEEVLTMTQEVEQLHKEVKNKTELENQYQQLNTRYQTLLELLGERTEQVEELKADLQDVKDMYKSQIVELVQKIDQLNGRK